MWHIRTAQDSDTEQLTGLAQQVFYDTFGPFNTDADMDLYCSQAFTPAVLAQEIADPDVDVVVVEHEGTLVGYAQLHRGEAPPEVPGPLPIELKRFYVLHARHGTGVAQELLLELAARSATYGAATLWLGVWEHNPRAIRFYQKCGFEETGEQPFLLGTDWQRDLIMSVPVEHLARALSEAIEGRRQHL